MKSYAVIGGILVCAALHVVASPVNFSECPAVGLDTSGCEILITVTATNGSGIATAFTVTTSSPDQGSYDGGDGTLIGILNSPSDTGGVFNLSFAIAPGTGSLDFDMHGACLGTGSPLESAYSPGPTAAQCLGGKYWTTDAMDYASANVTFPDLNSNDLADLIVNIGSPLGPGQSTWFSLPGDITASQITAVTPEPTSLVLVGIGLSALFMRRRKVSVKRTIG
ncbi:MAG TPA: PEP-CTERM sorting domain-containing protein [Bryobacteraceae bacterium]